MHTGAIMSTELRRDSGQSLLETALLMPLLLTLIFNAVNIAYFSYALLNLANAASQGSEYSIQGQSGNIGLPRLPSAANVSGLMVDGFKGAVASASIANTAVRVCSAAIGLSGAGTSAQIPRCATTYGSGSFPGLGATDADPEAPGFVLNRIDMQYTVTPLIPGGVFNVVLPSSLTLNRTVYMRAME
jgi:hypothetical protein